MSNKKVSVLGFDIIQQQVRQEKLRKNPNFEFESERMRNCAPWLRAHSRQVFKNEPNVVSHEVGER